MSKSSDLFKKNVNYLRQKFISAKEIIFSSEISVIFDDLKYKKHFYTSTGLEIYNMHLEENYICCAFCSKLKKSTCHAYCFSCSKKVYIDCSPLLPGTFPFTDSYFDSFKERLTPWIFKTPCTSFERLINNIYFKNFTSHNTSITAANFEVLEGLFIGISQCKRPCHICASINLDIYTKCASNERIKEDKPCKTIINEILSKCSLVSGMVKYDV